MSDPHTDITHLLNLAADGDDLAAQEVLPRIYEELRRLAGKIRSGMPAGETLRVTALVNEAYIRVVNREPEGWKARSHFFYAAARAMRDILVESARKKATKKRGGGIDIGNVDDLQIAMETPPEAVLALHSALEKLEAEDPEGHRVVMLRYFAGLNVKEVAETENVSVSTVERKWRFLRAWLRAELAGI